MKLMRETRLGRLIYRVRYWALASHRAGAVQRRKAPKRPRWGPLRSTTPPGVVMVLVLVLETVPIED